MKFKNADRALTIISHPLPWSVYHDEDVWIRDANGKTICINVFDLEFAQEIVRLANILEVDPRQLAREHLWP